MTNLRIYRLAMAELLRKINEEEKKKEGPIRTHRLLKWNGEYDELHKIIIEEKK